MGEDRVTTALADKKNGDVLPSSRQRHSSIMSSCSEDMESETNTSTGYPPTPEEEREEELEYGPGIVNKLRTRFLSITLKQNRGASMRRSCSMENLLDQDRPSRCCGNALMSQNHIGKESEDHKNWGLIKRAKSMDTLLMDLQQQQEPPQPPPPPPPVSLESGGGDWKKEPKIVRRRDGGLNRTGPTICDEELPKPDTVKTYKRMFEPAESRRGSYSRRPPVLRASAKSGSLSVSKTNGVSSLSSAKVSNGVASKVSSSGKSCAKQQSSSPPVKAQPNSEVISCNNNSSPNPQDSKPLCNGSFVKATPVKIIDNSVCNTGRKSEKTVVVEKEINGLGKKDTLLHNNQKNDGSVLCNGNSPYKEIITTTKSDAIDDYVKPDVKKLVNQTYKVLDGGSDSNNKVTNIVNGLKQAKPKVPPNRPAFVKNVRPGPKISDLNGIEKKTLLVPKLRPVPNSILKDSSSAKPCEVNGKTEPVVAPSEPALSNGKGKEIESKATNETKIVEEKNNRKNAEKLVGPETNGEVEKTNLCPKKEPEKEIINHANGEATESNDNNNKPPANNSKQPDLVDAVVKCEPTKPAKKQQQSSEPVTTSMVFDFRGKDVVPHVAVLPVPFGCKALHPKKKSLMLIDGKEVPNGDCAVSDEEDEYNVDYSVPPPCGVIFEGENVKIGKGSILCTRNKDLKIKFDDNVDDNTFVYPSETSLMEDSSSSEQSSLSPSPPPPPASEAAPSPSSEPSPSQPPSANKLKANTVIGSSGAGGLTTYTPSVLRTMDNFEPGMFRPPPVAASEKEDDKSSHSGEEENTEVREQEDEDMLKPADPGIISSWSLSAGTSDLLF